mmetsp:Transcript_85594/g.133806  ORF Transcript_85594/g.133806 Transcript_85594/m.133806 type:complete len:925 (+) Transcript_85594:57-2831(+)
MGVTCSCCCEKPARQDCCQGNAENDAVKGTAGKEEETEQDVVHRNTEDDVLADKKKRGGVRKGKEGRIGAAHTAESNGEEHLEKHKRPRTKGKETKKLIKTAMKQDRVCALLEEKEIETILETMEYFEFEPNEQVVKQGDVGTTFFVTHEGTMEVSVNGQVVNTIARARAFGGLALLYNCPRTASVTAKAKSSAWGANGATFHKVLQDNAKKNYAENRRFLDSIKLFEGLSVKQKDRVGESFITEVVDSGDRVVTEGEQATAMYFVKKGTLRVLAGAKIAAGGSAQGGTEIANIGSGEVFGERALLYNESRASTVIANEKCELLCIGGDQLREVLGNDLRQTLEQNIILASIRKSPIIGQFSISQQSTIVGAVTVKDFKSREKVPAGLRFAVVCDGVIEGKNKGSPVTLGRMQWYEQDSLVESGGADALSSLEGGKTGTLTELVAGSNGARVAILTEAAFAKTLKDLGLSQMSETDMVDYTKKMILVKKVQLFRQLAQEALDKLVRVIVTEKMKKGQNVITQGEMGDKFYIIAGGEVGVYIQPQGEPQKLIRTMPRNQFFGERALLFDEPRTATISVSTNEAELWSIKKAEFLGLVSSKMKEELVQRIRLQDTSVTMKDLKHIKVIGAGAAGTVRLVEHKKTKTRYALKRVLKEDGKVPEEVTRECALLGENDHPFIMTLVKTFETKSSVYMLTELITGGELHAAIRTIPTVLSRAQCQFYGGSLILVLEELAERNIVYRDLKPENVMLDQQGYLKLIDFGIAKKLEEGKTRTFTMIGTPHYMAPEVMRGHGYGTEVDIWSFGVMCFEFVCGFLPFADELDDPTEVCTAVLKDALSFPGGYKDQAGRNLIQSLLNRQPKKRLGGSGLGGYEDIKNHDYFKAGHPTSTVFTKILGRELDPPVAPPGEIYSEDVDGITLSDADELG